MWIFKKNNILINKLTIKKYLYLYSEVVFGEHTLGKEMDCVTSTDKQETVCTTTVIKRQVDKIIIHEDFNQDISNGNDIALIRLADPIPLHSENSTLSSVMPICLPWNR